ncbi:MAG TPA: helix-turn-helix domain-containing protein [Chloroflexota bacterium]|nr:helix-turn-helix domain-containing protein [Chloroflexota bacterium]
MPATRVLACEVYGHIGREIRAARRRLGMTQEELGACVELTRASLNNIEAGAATALDSDALRHRQHPSGGSVLIAAEGSLMSASTELTPTQRILRARMGGYACAAQGKTNTAPVSDPSI